MNTVSSIPIATHATRREALLQRVGGPILLLGNGPRARNLPMTQVAFRQDSTMLYFTGCAMPGAAVWIDESGTDLYLPTPDADDALWHGTTPSSRALAERYGVHRVLAHDELEARVRSATPRTLAVPDDARSAEVAGWLGRPLRFGVHHGDAELVHAVISLRRTKDVHELEAHRTIGLLTAQAHSLAMRMTRPGVTERALASAFEAFLAARNATLGYATILTQDGQILHHHGHDGVCEAGRLLLIDGGGEWNTTGHGADVTRTWPVSGRFSARQRAAYEAVLRAQEVSIDLCRPGVPYRQVHDAASLELAAWLLDEGLLHGCTAEEAVERGAHALFFPHGIGHLLGLDVHDLENFGDLPAYPPGAARPEPFGTRNLRLDLPLEAGWVVTIEPGFYVVPEILDAPELRARFRDVVDFERAHTWVGFGGIRIEDDVIVTDGPPDVPTASAPKQVDDVEAIVGTGATLAEVFG